MNPIIGSIFLISGTAIGAGMLALPLTLSSLGVIGSIIAMLVVWIVVYISSLVGMELNLQAKKGLPLGELGYVFSGRLAQVIGNVSLMFLMYALLSAYLHGASLLCQTLVFDNLGFHLSSRVYLVACVLIAFFVLSSSMKGIDSINRMLLLSLLVIFSLLISGFQKKMSIHSIPLIEQTTFGLKSWFIAIPVVFTSFGFQVVFHSVYNYIGHHPKRLKWVLAFGSLLPLLVYLFWTLGVIIVTSDHAVSFYQRMLLGKGDIAELVTVLVRITDSVWLKQLAWFVMILAIATSFIGVGLGLRDMWSYFLSKMPLASFLKSRQTAAFVSLVPSMLVALYFSNIFIKALSIAGLLLTVIAVFLPFFLLSRIPTKHYHYVILRSQSVRLIVLGLTGCIILSVLGGLILA